MYRRPFQKLSLTFTSVWVMESAQRSDVHWGQLRGYSKLVPNGVSVWSIAPEPNGTGLARVSALWATRAVRAHRAPLRSQGGKDSRTAEGSRTVRFCRWESAPERRLGSLKGLTSELWIYA